MQASRPLSTNHQQGFTLIELSIVLVIIGLIVGGVLVGQDLIKAGQIRAQITQLSQMDTAANSFHGKYNGLPGDYVNPAAIINGATGMGTGTGLGNGNGLIEASSGTPTAGLTGEPAMFFSELSQSANVFNIPITTTSFTATPNISTSVLPPAALGSGNYVAVGNNGSTNYYMIGNYSGAVASGEPATVAAALTPGQALALDSKLDDGYPNTGIILAVPTAGNVVTPVQSGTASSNGGTAGGTAGCYNTTPTPNVYSAVTLNTVYCNVAIKTSF